MRPEPTKFMFDVSRTKKMLPYCFDSISAEKYKSLVVEEDPKTSTVVEESPKKSSPVQAAIPTNTTKEQTKETTTSTTDASPLKASRDNKLSESSSVDRTSEDEESTDGKPNHSYISLIANAILSSKEKRLVLSDIYQYVLDTQPYFRNKAGQGWRNSIRHNLSLNECFIKAGRSPNGKGHFWAINPANFDDFSKGDFRRRRAQRRARRAMVFGDLIEQFGPYWASHHQYSTGRPTISSYAPPSSTSYRYSPYYPMPASSHRATCRTPPPCLASPKRVSVDLVPPKIVKSPTTAKRGFDVESLLRDDKEDRVERPVPTRVMKRPSSTDITPSFTPRISPYTRLNLDYFAEKRGAPFGSRCVGGSAADLPPSMTGAPSLYDRYRSVYPTVPRSHYIRADEHFKLSMV